MLKRAVDSAKEAFRKSFSMYNRYEVLLRVAQLLKDNSEEFAQAIAEEVGKPINEARGEVAKVAEPGKFSRRSEANLWGSNPSGSCPG